MAVAPWIVSDEPAARRVAAGGRVGEAARAPARRAHGRGRARDVRDRNRERFQQLKAAARGR